MQHRDRLSGYRAVKIKSKNIIIGTGKTNMQKLILPFDKINFFTTKK